MKRTVWKRAAATVFACILLAAAGCAAPARADTCRVMVESGEHYSVASPVREVERGGNATFQITPESGYFIADIN